MKLLSVFLSLSALSLPIRSTAALPSPNLIPTTQTAVTVDTDSSSSFLTSGELVLHIIRTDDLLADGPHRGEKELVLERLTHLVLNVKLDKSEEDEARLILNGEEIGLHARGVKKVVRSEALFLSPDSEFVKKEALTKTDLQGLLPPGIVSAEITVVEESSTPPSTISIDLPQSDKATEAEILMKSYKVSLKILEIESHSLSHITKLSVPILQIQLSYVSSPTAGEQPKLVQMKAFALKPSAKTNGEGDEKVLGKWGKGRGRGRNGRKGMGKGKKVAPSSQEEDTDLVGEDSDRHLEEDETDADLPPTHLRHHGDHHSSEDSQTLFRHHHRRRPPPPMFVRWIAGLMGWTPHHRHPHSEDGRHRHPHPHSHHVDEDEHRRGPHHDHEQEKEHGRHPHHHEKEHGEEVDLAVLDSNGESPSPPHLRRPHQFPHGHRHSHRRLFWCRVRHVLHHPATFIVLGLTKLGLFFGLVFLGARRVSKIVRRRREGAVRLEEEEEEEKGEKA